MGRKALEVTKESCREVMGRKAIEGFTGGKAVERS